MFGYKAGSDMIIKPEITCSSWLLHSQVLAWLRFWKTYHRQPRLLLLKLPHTPVVRTQTAKMAHPQDRPNAAWAVHPLACLRSTIFLFQQPRPLQSGAMYHKLIIIVKKVSRLNSIATSLYPVWIWRVSGSLGWRNSSSAIPRQYQNTQENTRGGATRPCGGAWTVFRCSGES